MSKLYIGAEQRLAVAIDISDARASPRCARSEASAFISAEVKGQVVSGDVWIAQLWNGDTAQASKEQPNIAYCLPKDGAALWTDSLVIPKGAQHNPFRPLSTGSRVNRKSDP